MSKTWYINGIFLLRRRLFKVLHSLTNHPDLFAPNYRLIFLRQITCDQIVHRSSRLFWWPRKTRFVSMKANVRQSEFRPPANRPDSWRWWSSGTDEDWSHVLSLSDSLELYHENPWRAVMQKKVSIENSNVQLEVQKIVQVNFSKNVK